MEDASWTLEVVKGQEQTDGSASALWHQSSDRQCIYVHLVITSNSRRSAHGAYARLAYTFHGRTILPVDGSQRVTLTIVRSVMLHNKPPRSDSHK